MKKKLFGYDKKEVDEILGTLADQNASLVAQNDYLEQELKSLQQKLADAQAVIGAGMTQMDLDNYKSLKLAYAALQDNLHDLEKQKGAGEELKAQLEEIRAENDKLKEESERHIEELKTENEALKAEAEKLEP